LHDIIYNAADDIGSCLEVLQALDVCYDSIIDMFDIPDVEQMKSDVECVYTMYSVDDYSLSDETVVDLVNASLDVFYDFCDEQRIWTGIGA
jgi:hypothetical protein